MALQTAVLADLLEGEAAVARTSLGDRIHRLEVLSPNVVVEIDDGSALWRLQLDGTYYDEEPFRVAAVGSDDQLLTYEGWPHWLRYEGVPQHPVMHRPWACLRGTYEYHTFPGHTAGDDAWAVSRSDLRLPELLDHICQRAGR
jgi:hypothetical protein